MPEITADMRNYSFSVRRVIGEFYAHVYPFDSKFFRKVHPSGALLFSGVHSPPCLFFDSFGFAKMLGQ